MSKNFRTNNLETDDLFADDLPGDDLLAKGRAKDQAPLPSDENKLVDSEEDLINELDSLRFVLDEGPEYQHHIPLQQEAGASPEKVADIESIENIVDPDSLDVPILTDACITESPQNNSQTDNLEATTPVAPVAEPSTESPIEQTNNPEEALTSIAHAAVDELLDTLMEEYLPQLEAKLRQELSKKVHASIDSSRGPEQHTGDENPSDKN